MKIGVVGCTGRMGRMALKEVLSTPEAVLVGGVDREDSPHIGGDLGALAGLPAVGLTAATAVEEIFSQADAVIDFTAPSALGRHTLLAARFETALIVGTTGLEEEHRAQLCVAAKHVPVVQAPNMSVGVTLMLALTEKIAQTLGVDYDIEIVEMHHREKLDAPSGTALALGKSAAKGRAVPLESVAIRSRDGMVGARPEGNIGFATLRGGDVVGEHTVIFAGEGERLEITHKASSRSIFAQGAVRAALWTKGRPPGLYSMVDVLDLA